jgi:GNAT superfamily N-acetyltransferase
MTSSPFLLRPPLPGDLGWIVQRHGELYAKEHGWGPKFEALVARVVADFVDSFDANRERCWIADVRGERAGSIMLVKKSDTFAKLRLLLVEPNTRGMGIGKALTNECITFARSAGYSAITLWTCSVLHAARRIYESTGFKLIQECPDPLFNPGELGQEWELKLS